MTGSKRYMSRQEFGRLLADLCLTDTMFQDQLLEFLEKERLVVPAARVFWPRAIVVEEQGGTPDSPASPAERADAEALNRAISHWSYPNADPAVEHPLDSPNVQGASLVCRNFTTRPFEPWITFRTMLRGRGDTPYYVHEAVDTYYHAWQALLVADALELGVHVVIDTRRPEVISCLIQGDLPGALDFPHRTNLSLRAPRGLTNGVKWGAYLDASAQVAIVRQRMQAAISRKEQGPPRQLTVEEQAKLLQVLVPAAHRTLRQINATRDQFVHFLRYLCERWDEWDRRGRAALANEYKHWLARSVSLARIAYDVDFNSLSLEVGRVTGHRTLTLDAIFPDCIREAREDLARSLRFAALPNAPPAGELSLRDTDVDDLCDWLDRRGLFKLHLSIKEVLQRQFSGDHVDQVALAKEVESIGTNFEHLINEMVAEVGLEGGDTLMRKLISFWESNVDVHALLKDNTRLVSTRGSVKRTERLARIEAVQSQSPRLGVAQILLRAVLNRNSGTHESMACWSDAELHDAIRDFLLGLMLCRKQMLSIPPTGAHVTTPGISPADRVQNRREH